MTRRVKVSMIVALAALGCADDRDTDSQVQDASTLEVLPGHLTERSFDVADELWAVWGGPPDRVFAVGRAGGSAAVFAFEGQDFQREALPDDAAGELVAIAGSEEAGLWAVGPGLILKRGPLGWEHQNRDRYLAVSCSSVFVEDDGRVWITESSGTFIRFDGNTWDTLPAPAHPTLTAIWGDGEAIWAITEAGAILREDGNGNGFHVAARPTEAPLRAVWGSSAKDVWVVGDRGALLHTGGATWISSDAAAGADLRAIGGTSANDVWAAGKHGTLLHFDGRSWRRIPQDAKHDFTGLFARSKHEVWLTTQAGTVLVLKQP